MRTNNFASVLAVSGFRNLWLSQAISQIFVNVLYFFLMIRVYELTTSNTAVSLLVLTFTIPNFLIGAIAGVLVDRWDRKIVMFVSHFLRIFAVLAFLLSSESLFWIYTLSLLISVVTQFFFPAEAGSIAKVVPDRKLLLTANTIYSLTFFSSVIVGNILAGPIFELVGSTSTFLIVAGAFSLASIFSAQVPGMTIWEFVSQTIRKHVFKLPLSKREIEKGTLFSEFLQGLDFLYKTKNVQKALVVMAMGQIILGMLASVAPGFAHKVLGVAVSNVSLLVMAPAALGMVASGLIVGQYFHKYPKEKLIERGILMAAVLLVLFGVVDKIAFISHLPLIFVSFGILIFLGAANAFLDIPVHTLIQESTPEEIRSRVYGVLTTITGAASVVPIIFAGGAADLFGVRVVILTMGALLLIFGLYNRRF